MLNNKNWCKLDRDVVTFAGSAVGYGLGHVPVVALFAVVAVAAGCVVPAVETHATASSARKFV